MFHVDLAGVCVCQSSNHASCRLMSCVCVCQTSDHAPCGSCRLMSCVCVSDQQPCSVRVLPADVMCLCVRPATMLRAGLAG